MPQMTFRLATLDDAAILFAWRNDQETRKNSHVTTEIDYDSHCRWLEDRLSRPDTMIWIAEIGSQAIGTVRAANQEDGSVLLSWTIAPEARGQGLAQSMVKQISEQFLAARTLHAQVKIGNAASEKVAIAAGLELGREENGTLYFKRRPLFGD